MKIFRIIKNHPKKIIFFGGLIGFGVNYGKGKYNEQCLMRAYCEEASKFGELSHHLTDEERHITVILNPAANNGKCYSKYEKYCAPLLHLAGMKVALVKTEHEDQAKQIMEVMDNTQAVVVAGGDGTLSEILTGLFRRDDVQKAVKQFPLGILPLGESNSVASSIWGFNKVPEAKHLGEATMSIVKNLKRDMSIMEITPLEENEAKKPVYAASEIEWGAFRDTKERKSIYWYYGFLKKYMVYVFSSYKNISWNCSGIIDYSLPCKGCSRCKEKEEKEAVEAFMKKPKRWWEAFVPRSKDNQFKEMEKIDYSSIINEKCGEVHQLNFENVCDVRIATCNNMNSQNMEGHALSLRIGKENMSTLQFIKEGWQRERGGIASHEQEIILGEIILNPSEEAKKDFEGKERHLNIDNESFEIKSMKIRPKPNAVTIFASPES